MPGEPGVSAPGFFYACNLIGSTARKLSFTNGDNGMRPPVPEATIEVTKVVKNHRTNQLEFHLGKVIEVKLWDRKRNIPATP
jgi:hypothetical protein